MGILSLVVPLLALAPSAFAQHIDLQIPQVQSIVASITSKYAAYVDYSGPATAVPTEVVLKKTKTSTTSAPSATGSCAYWMENIQHQGVAAFNDNSSYVVFRNVKDYGAVGDGVTDDTAAIQRAIADGRPNNAPIPGITSTNNPAVVYFPSGTYLISSAILDYYYTQLIGNPNCMPTLLAAANIAGFGVIDGDQYAPPDYSEAWGSTNVFFRQVRNFIIDMRRIPASSAATGIHWPTAQATSLQNIVFYLNEQPGTQHTGVFIEDGSGGFITDLVFHGGLNAMQVGNQQFTIRNITISNSVYGIHQLWSWGFTYIGLNINNVTIAVDITSGSPPDASVHALTVIDSTISNAQIAFNTNRNASINAPASEVLNLENIVLTNVTRAVTGGNGTVVAGTNGTMRIAAYTQGRQWSASGPSVVQGLTTANPRPAKLLGSTGTNFYVRSKPQYGSVPLSSVISVRSYKAKGNGIHDDTKALQNALDATAAAGQVLFIDAGTYIVTDTVVVPPGARVVGESYSVIMSSGAKFNKIKNPRAVVQVGTAGQTGIVELSDLIISTQANNGGQIGAILIEWNLAAPSATPGGMWDVHTRIGGSIGSNLQGNICPTTPSSPKTDPSEIDMRCYAAYMSMHVTSSAAGLYLENNWFWTADHDIDANYGGNQITVYTGRGLLVESTQGGIWLYGTAVEHHSLYQYQFVNTQDIVMGQIQTETAYWQPNPNASVPFAANAMYNDPVFPTSTFHPPDNPSLSIPNADGWGFRAVNSTTLLIYGAGLYSFFNNYSTMCSNNPGNETCQSRIFAVEGTSTVYLYDLHTVGTHEVITYKGADVALWSQYYADFTENVCVFRTT